MPWDREVAPLRDPRPPAPLLAGIAGAVLLALAHSGEIRARAEAALGEGMPAREAELARGFVLGQDERIDAATAEDFRRSGLAHLLAVSGQNVALLGLLGMWALAALRIPLRTRLVWVLGLIAVYVPLAGSEPSILRAGVMGAVSLLAVLAGRRSSRLHALAVAAIVTLAADPTLGADVGWQLSFAAVLGILLLAAPLRAAIAARVGSRGWRLAIAEGAAMTAAATLATAPLIAFHFGEASTTTLAANLLALPAVAPAMWLGMLTAAAGQVPGFPVEAVNALNAPLLAYVAQVAAWLGRPRWAAVEVEIGGAGLAGAYAALAAGGVLALRLGRARRLARLRKHRLAMSRTLPSTSVLSRLFPHSGEKCERKGHGPRGAAPGRRLAACAVVAVAVAALAWAPLTPGDGTSSGPLPGGLRVSMLDVGQGDAILLQPAGGEAVLVDAGPPGAGIAALLGDAGVQRLGAAVVTHPQSDHAGGLPEAIGAVPVGLLLYGRLGAAELAAGRAAGVATRRVASGTALRSGRLRLEVLWPPRELLAARPAGSPVDPNRLALVLLARHRGFTMLLAADAEAEAVPLDPGPLDVLKVAHHGSEDAGLSALLDRTRPKLALISAGEGNPHGHPAAATLSTLAKHRIPTLRTDLAGAIVLDIVSGKISLVG